MRKTTEELRKEAGFEQPVSDIPAWEGYAEDFETFRRLCIENERECAEAVGVTASLPGTNNGYTFVAFNGSDVPVGTKLFTFPPAAQVSEEWKPIETAPRDGTRVLIVNDDGEIDVAGYVEEWQERSEFVRKAKDGDVYRTVREDCGYWDTDRACCPTHWMPLPAAPEVKP